MGRPEDIPEDVWAAAMSEAAKYVEWAFQTRNVDADAEYVLATSISRMVLAERLKERGACAQIAADRWREFDAKLASGNVPEHLQERAVGRAFEGQYIAQAIRSRP